MKRRWARALASLLVSGGLIWGCGSDATFGGNEGDDDGAGAGIPQPDPQAGYVGATGVNIQQVSIYQGPERILALGHTPQPSAVPLVAGRDALLRVFYQPAPEHIGKTVLARLEIGGHDQPLEFETAVGSGSTQEALESTINFLVPGDLIGEQFEYRVSILEQGEVDHLDAHHPIEGLEAHAVQGPRNTFRIVLVPFQYNADGSGRVPDLGPEGAEIYRQRLLQLYPVSDVELVVREPVPWNQPIAANGGGWQEVGIQLSNIREAEKPSDDWYYYGIFQPASSLYQYCGQGCLLGVTLLNDQPVEQGNPMLRIALGVGFPEVGPGTTAHELGHAHGRMHAPCGPGVQQIDPAFPHAGGGIGPWSWDIVSQQLVNPASVTDMMGYCDNEWISDYSYAALLARGQHVNAPLYQPAPTGHTEQLDRVAYDLITVDAAGEARYQQTLTRERLVDGSTLPVRLDKAGSQRTVDGHFYRYDHLPGGWLLVPSGDFDPSRAVFELDGVTRDVVMSD